MQKNILTKEVKISIFLIFFIFLTRVSHELTLLSLPDASLIIFFAAGIFLKNIKWLLFFVSLIVGIDLYAINANNMLHINLTFSYWVYVTTYLMSWYAGKEILSGRPSLKALIYIPTILGVLVMAFIISYSSHYFLSGWINNPEFYGNLLFLKANLSSFLVPNLTYAIVLIFSVKVLGLIKQSKSSEKFKTN